MPLVTTLLRRLGLSATACAQLGLAVAEGALMAVRGADQAPGGPVPPAPLDERPTRELPLLSGAPMAEPVAGTVPRRRPVWLLVAATGLVCAAVLAGLVAVHQPQRVATGGEGHPTATRPAAGDAVAGAVRPRGGQDGRWNGRPQRVASAVSTSASAVPPSTPSTSPPASGGTTPVTVSVIASPAVATCATEVTFVVHFTLNDTGRYRWHWVLGGPNGYTFTSGDQDLDKTGDAHLTRKFNASGSLGPGTDHLARHCRV